MIPVYNPKVGTRYVGKDWVWEWTGYCWTNIQRVKRGKIIENENEK